MAKTTKQIIGEKGEEFACQYLAEKEYEILEKNYRFKRAEVDIIVKKEKFLKAKAVLLKGILFLTTTLKDSNCS